MRESGIKLIPSPIPQAMIIVGNQSRYQKLILILMSAIYFQLATIILGLSYLFMEPSFNCSFSEIPLDQGYACQRISQCQIINNYTITGYLNLYCDKQIYRNFVQSVFPIGAMTGLIFMNFVCDTKGRRVAVLTCLTCSAVGSLITALGVWSNTIVLIVIAQILNGFGAYSLALIPYIIFFDVCSDSLRQRCIILMSVVWGAAQMMFFIYDNIELSWDRFLIFIEFIPLVTLIILINRYMLQSPNFILDHKKNPQNSLQVLYKIAEYNQTSIQDKQKLKNLINDYYTLKKRISSERGYSTITSLNMQRIISKLFRNWQHTKPIFILTFAYMSVYLFYFGVEYSLNLVGFSYALNMLLMGLMQLCGFGVMYYYSSLVQQTQRKKGFIFFFLLTGLFGFMFVANFISKSVFLATFVISTSRFISTAGQIFFSFLQTQSFRPKVRSAGAGIIQGLAQTGIFYAHTYYLCQQIFKYNLCMSQLLL